ncbi:unnamed protein product [Effrenium voratum]|uniref:Cyclin-dependent kinase 2 homolog n=1 Tax=Effrenium voratum TaxID=2562239 RepID=A0AA36J1V0_9DINO|nr:unnamed protein product [Effrenium voratum]CAJ1398080.1 unnamed protein product [Effrenium voratum]CAJ1450631.1 unnamed protein product [Effrenium voratum]
MSRYEKLGAPVGEGTYGTVWKGVSATTQDEVAMKKVVIRHEKEGFPTTAIREIRALRKLSHPNVVRLVDVYTEMPGANGSIGDTYLIFEYAPHDLTGYVAYRKKLKLAEVKCVGKQLAEALDFCHLNRVMHRDLKPSNILLTHRGELKLCDFGLSRDFVERTPQSYSVRVITLWYRPPELLLGSGKYDPSVDVWSAGCIIGELLVQGPLFPDSSEVQVFKRIRMRFAAHKEEQWPQSIRKLPHWDKFWPQTSRNINFDQKDVFRDLAVKHGQTAVDVLKATLHLDPSQRIDSAGLVQHPFFESEPLPCKPSDLKMPADQRTLKELDVKRRREKAEEEVRAEREQAKQMQKRNHLDGGRVGEPSPKRQRPA